MLFHKFDLVCYYLLFTFSYFKSNAALIILLKMNAWLLFCFFLCNPLKLFFYG